MKYLLPLLMDDDNILPGEFFECLQFCTNNSFKGKCKEFYKNLRKGESGFYTCPHGLSVYYYNNNFLSIIFTGFRECGTYNKAKALRTNEKVYNPVLEHEQILKLINSQISLASKESVLNDEVAIVKSIVHEVKKLNVQIKEHCEYIWSEYTTEDNQTTKYLTFNDIQTLFERIRTITVCSNMMFSRFSMYDYTNNPSSFAMGAQFKCNVYKKFDKIRLILRNYLKKNVIFRITGNSYYEFTAYPSFEIIPLLLLENAVKYSTPDDEINIKFHSSSQHLKVEIISKGPYCSDNDINNIFIKGFRGENAQKISDGSGLGMYFVKAIGDLHRVAISVLSINKHQDIAGIEYGDFKVTMVFPE